MSGSDDEAHCSKIGKKVLKQKCAQVIARLSQRAKQKSTVFLKKILSHSPPLKYIFFKNVDFAKKNRAATPNCTFLRF